MATQPKYTAGDYRPATGSTGAHTQPRYDAGDYRPGWKPQSLARGATGKAKRAKRSLHGARLAAGVKDPWGGFGVRRGG